MAVTEHEALHTGNTYYILDSHFTGCGVGPNSTLDLTLLNYINSQLGTKENPIPELVVHKGKDLDLPEGVFIAELQFNKQSPLANDLRAASLLLFKETERLFRIAFFLLNAFQH